MLIFHHRLDNKAAKLSWLVFEHLANYFWLLDDLAESRRYQQRDKEIKKKKRCGICDISDPIKLLGNTSWTRQTLCVKSASQDLQNMFNEHS